MVNLKTELFDFKKGLNFETQEGIAKIVEAHFNAVELYSEKAIINSLTDALSIHTYDRGVKALLENLNDDLKTDELLYNLKDLLKIIESKNQGAIYRIVTNLLLEIINTEDAADRNSKIINELAIHNWVPEVRTFIVNLQSNPQKRQNLLNGGNADSVYTIVESVENGHLALIDECWFFISEDKIEKTLLENHLTDASKIALLRTLQTAMLYASVNEDRIDFKLDENIVIGLSTKNPGTTFINEDKLEKDTTISTIFSTAIVPIAKKQFYPLIEAIANNMDKIIDLDIVKHITNIGNPYLEYYVFNYSSDLYLYSKDARQGTSFFKYESAMELLNDVKNEMQYDLTYFFENRLDTETKSHRQLEDKIREIQVNLDEIDTNKEKVEANIQMLGESAELSAALKLLSNKKAELDSDLLAVKKVQYDLFHSTMK